ncbi:MAG TPA: SpoIIE family protein phosphatase, partial [Phycisphaerae bacterium]|nr:SpoIIE family protein phosphatase [Phycisphaerae bacterium]
MNNVTVKQLDEFQNFSIKVLLVDDQAMIGEAVRRMLESEKDIEFNFCSDPTKAVNMANEIKPTVILQDLVMPEIDGLTLVKFYRANPTTREVPLIVLSTKEEGTTKAEAFSLGANDYIVKLPDKLELIARIRYHSKGYINMLQRNETYEKLQASQQALANELAKAAKYVISLLPCKIEKGLIRTDWIYIPSMQLGGDTFGYHWIDDENFAIFLLDVCGHGVDAALLSVSAMNVMRSQTLPDVDFRKPDQELCGLNEAFQMEDHNDMFFTIWYGVYNKKTRELQYASGGHHPAILIEPTDAGGRNMMQLISDGMLIGAMRGIKFNSGICTVKPG